MSDKVYEAVCAFWLAKASFLLYDSEASRGARAMDPGDSTQFKTAIWQRN